MTQLTLNLNQGTVSFNFSNKAAQTLKKEVSELMARFKTLLAQSVSYGKVCPQEAMNYIYDGKVFIELFCNPNIYPNPFTAKVLLTIRDNYVQLTTEVELTRVIEDLERYLKLVG